MSEALEATLAAVGLWIAAGFVLALLVRYVLVITNPAILAAVLLVPAAFGLLVDDRLESINLLGVELKLREAAAQPVQGDSVARPADTAEGEIALGLFDTSEILGAEAPMQNLEQLAFWAKSTHVLTIRASQWNFEIPVKLQDIDGALGRAIPIAVVLYNSLLSGGFEALVVLDDRDMPLGVFEASYFYDLLRIPVDAIVPFGRYADLVPSNDMVLALLQQTNLWGILRGPKVRAESDGNKAWISARASRLEALHTINKKRFDVLVLTDDRGAYAGIVSRNDLVSNLLYAAIHTNHEP
jgi:CBS domain